MARWCVATRAKTRCSRPDPATITIPLYWFRPPMTLGTTRRACIDSRGTSLPADRRRESSRWTERCPLPPSVTTPMPAPTTPWAQSRLLHRALTVNGKALLAIDCCQAGSAGKARPPSRCSRSTACRRPRTTAPSRRRRPRVRPERSGIRLRKCDRGRGGPSSEALAASRQEGRGARGCACCREPRGRGQRLWRWTRRRAGRSVDRDTDERRCGTVGSHDLPAGRRRAADDDAVERNCERACVGACVMTRWATLRTTRIGGAELGR